MTVSEIALKYIPPVQCIAHSKKICNKNAKHKSGMLKNINTKQTQEFYSKDAKPNSKIHEQIQLKFFIRFQSKKEKKKILLRSPLWETKKRINRIGGGKRDKQVGGVPIYKKYLHSEFKRT